MNTRRLIFKILLVLYLITVAWLCFGNFSSLPNVKMSYWGIPTDKIVHFLMFFPFPLICFGAFDKYTTKPWHSVLFVVTVFCIGCFLAGATEIGQSMTKYRTGDQFDFLADGLALGISSLIVLILDLRKQFK